MHNVFGLIKRIKCGKRMAVKELEAGVAVCKAVTSESSVIFFVCSGSHLTPFTLAQRH